VHAYSPAPHSPARILIAADRPAFGELLFPLFAERGYWVELVASTQPAAILAAALATHPDIVVLDIEMRRGTPDGLRLISRLRAIDARVIAFAPADAVSLRVAYARASVDAIACRSEPVENLLMLAERLLRCEMVPLLEVYQHVTGETCAFEVLTPQEKRVLIRLMNGDAPRRIAENTGLSTATVRGHIQSILSKMGASSQLAVIAEAHKQGWPRARAAAN
jgi:two-component system, NarL family, response regulator